MSEIVFIAGKGLIVWGAATPSRSFVQGEKRVGQSAARNDMRNRILKRFGNVLYHEHNAASLFMKLRLGILRGKCDPATYTPRKYFGLGSQLLRV